MGQIHYLKVSVQIRSEDNPEQLAYVSITEVAFWHQWLLPMNEN